MGNIIVNTVAALPFVLALLLLPGFYLYSPTSNSTKIQSSVLLCLIALSAYTNLINVICHVLFTFAENHPYQTLLLAFAVGAPLRYLQQKLRYFRLNAIRMRHGFTSDPESWKNLTVEQAHEIEVNMAEWEFPRLWQWGWISEFFRISTNPGTSRTIIASGHVVSDDLYVVHERLQASIHLMSAFMAHPVHSSPYSLAISRMNEHHHRYGTKINSDDVLFLIVTFAFAPVAWINNFGYRQLEDFEVQAMWVLWREIACRMGVKYIPYTVEQARAWRKDFEDKLCWREESNQTMSIALLDQLMWPVPAFLLPFARKLAVSVFDHQIVHGNSMEFLRPSYALRTIIFDIFGVCKFFIRNFSLPRLSAYRRSPDGPDSKTGLWNFVHSPYDTLPFFFEQTFWNRWGFGAIFRRLRNQPIPSAEYMGEGVSIESLGVPHPAPSAKIAVEQRIRDDALVLQHAPYGYRPHVGYQVGRLIAPVKGPEYGLSMNRFADETPYIPTTVERFDKQYQHRTPAPANSDDAKASESALVSREECPVYEGGEQRPAIST